jgi:transposase
MSRFKGYSPDQAYLLPPSVRDELGKDHLCFFVRRVVERLDLKTFERSYREEGGELYAPQLMLSVWLYAYVLGISGARQVERRLVENLAFRYLAAGERVDNWTLSAFRRRHCRALNDAFTQVLEWAQAQGVVKLGRVAIDSTRIQAKLWHITSHGCTERRQLKNAASTLLTKNLIKEPNPFIHSPPHRCPIRHR